MSVRKIRKIIRAITGLDVHRYKAKKDKVSWLESFDIKTVIDVGANIGQTAREMRERFPDAAIYSFEPIKECFEELAKSMAGDKKFKAFNVAIGDTSEERAMNKSAYSQSSSLLSMGQLHKDLFPHSSEQSKEKITIKRLDEIPEIMPEKLEKEILFKIDVQGYEDKVIRGSEKVIAQSKAVLVENSFVPLYDGQPLFAEIYETLVSRGFTYRGALWQKTNPNTGEVIFEDSLFVRKK